MTRYDDMDWWFEHLLNVKDASDGLELDTDYKMLVLEVEEEQAGETTPCGWLAEMDSSPLKLKF